MGLTMNKLINSCSDLQNYMIHTLYFNLLNFDFLPINILTKVVIHFLNLFNLRFDPKITNLRLKIIDNQYSIINFLFSIY